MFDILVVSCSVINLLLPLLTKYVETPLAQSINIACIQDRSLYGGSQPYGGKGAPAPEIWSKCANYMLRVCKVYEICKSF